MFNDDPAAASGVPTADITSHPLAARITAFWVPASGGGATGGHWSGKGMLAILRFTQHMRPGASLQTVVADAFRLFHSAEDVASAIETGIIKVPSISVLWKAKVQLDMLNILFQRTLIRKHYILRYYLLDSSPVFGRNFLAVREDRLLLPAEAKFNTLIQAQVNINSLFETRLLPISTLGAGHSSGLKKAWNLANILVMESACDENFDEVRSSILGITSDQGAERAVADESVHILSAYQSKSYAGSQGFIFPRALIMLGHMHLL